MAATLSTMRTRLNTLLDDDTTEFYSDAERNNALNGAYYELYLKAVSLNDGQGEEVTTSTLTITSGTETIALPSDFLRLVSLDFKESDTEFIKWKPIHPGDRNLWARKLGQQQKLKAYYRRGNNIVLVPEPSFTDSSSLLLSYVPVPTAMSADGDEPTGIPDPHRELIVYKALERLKEKEGIALSPGSEKTMRNLEIAFERDLDVWQDADARTLSGPDGYELYDARF